MCPSRPSSEDLSVMQLLKTQMSKAIEGSAYNWIRPSIWDTVTSNATKQSSAMGGGVGVGGGINMGLIF